MECKDLIKILLALLIVAGGYLYIKKRSHQQPGELNDFQQIIDKKALNVLTLSGSMSYFIYKGEIKGYEYELLNDFAENNNLLINIKLADNETKLTEMLENGDGDLIAYNIPITKEGKEHLIYCGREVINEQVLIQRANRKDTVLKDVVDLIGKEVWLIHDSKYYRRMVNLNDELGGGIQIRTIDKDTISTEDLIEMVAKGKIPYTVSDIDLAKLNKTYFRNINISLVVGHPQRSSWAVRKTMPGLAEEINRWFENKNNPNLEQINKRYFEMSKVSGEMKPLLKKGRISPFDEFFKKYAGQYGYDWRLLASISFQESNFLPNCSSWEGASGLMGLMPRTAKALGVSGDELYDPEQNIKAACKLLVKLEKYFSRIDKEERIKYVLGAYNAGQAHIMDAQALAEKYGKNPASWEDVESYLLLKSQPEYYNDSVCRVGYLRGRETVNYVSSVMERWDYYKNKVNSADAIVWNP
ncbi:MAG: transglycosylase SLT domain-containing protein [Dysgonamonadaceae bacterium]|jgi:membrane-bound lytic murein transglycosylase F|nr:transglycosylase SLT domain-containing protein [Dysgonamonadaceae bacterium]